jgi:DNA-directed RNA polymerase specialized sigma subunit, sigma24 homolog
MKKCTKCFLPKTLDEFRKDSRLKSGRASICTLCDRARTTQPRRAARARKAAELEALVASYRPVSRAIAAELVYDRSLRDDCVQEALIRVWEILKREPDASRPYIHKSIKRRIMDISMRQTFTGHAGRQGVPVDPLRRPHNSLDEMLALGWEPTD